MEKIIDGLVNDLLVTLSSTDENRLAKSKVIATQMRDLLDSNKVRLFPTAVLDINMTILCIVAYKDLKSILLTCKELHTFMSNELLWATRIKNEYGWNLNVYVNGCGKTNKYYYECLDSHHDNPKSYDLLEILIIEGLTDPFISASPDFSNDPARSRSRYLRRAVTYGRYDIVSHILINYEGPKISDQLITCDTKILKLLIDADVVGFGFGVSREIQYALEEGVYLENVKLLLSKFKCDLYLRKDTDEEASDILIQCEGPMLSQNIMFLHPSKVISAIIPICLADPSAIPKFLFGLYASRARSKLPIRDFIKAIPFDVIPNNIFDPSYNLGSLSDEIISILPAEFVYTDISECVVSTLKAILRRKGLKLTGHKAELLQRIKDSQNGII